MNWDKQGGTHFLDVHSVGRYSIARKAKGSREFTLKLNAKPIQCDYTTVDMLKKVVEGLVSQRKTKLVYDLGDPAQHVGEFVRQEGTRILIRWHSNYESWLKDEHVANAPADARIGDKLAMAGYGRIS